ncbi:PilN domain-containing protein [Bacillus suaedaesalsae]|uniref:Type IV pilus assembly protein PilN n=1 Tax=Bacillus suaedaesalsae TaxID=2810349 RepID=A0ABS2DN13_9BACI|nr:hypothetical protein [Bacillus suaedaesalsae]MBM6619752.1 hypothetical protein [Bacillus suaedaesalsae]
MLVDINLLPEKQKKKYTFPIIVAGLILLTAIVSIFLYLEYDRLQNETTYAQKKLQDTKLLRTKQEQKLKDYASSSAITELTSAIEWAEEQSVPTVPLIRHLSSLLPERGYVLNFDYTAETQVNFTVQFDTSREAAYYYKSLKDSPMINDVALSSIITSVSDDEPDVKQYTAFLLPRYIAQYQLKLNNRAIKDSEKEEVAE